MLGTVSQGLVRFATSEYSTKGGSALKDRFAHLTNYSVNKKSDDFKKNQDAQNDGAGSKWSLSALLRHLHAEGVDTRALMGRIQDVVIKTLLTCEDDVAS